jgi:hypothetical protein
MVDRNRTIDIVVLPFVKLTLANRAGRATPRLETGPRRPAFDRHIDIGRIDVEPTEAPASPAEDIHLQIEDPFSVPQGNLRSTATHCTVP